MKSSIAHNSFVREYTQQVDEAVETAQAFKAVWGHLLQEMMAAGDCADQLKEKRPKHWCQSALKHYLATKTERQTDVESRTQWTPIVVVLFVAMPLVSATAAVDQHARLNESYKSIERNFPQNAAVSASFSLLVSTTFNTEHRWCWLRIFGVQSGVSFSKEKTASSLFRSFHIAVSIAFSMTLLLWFGREHMFYDVFAVFPTDSSLFLVLSLFWPAKTASPGNLSCL